MSLSKKRDFFNNNGVDRAQNHQNRTKNLIEKIN